MVVKSTMFPYRNIHKYTWTSPDGKTHNQIDYILVDRRRRPRFLDVQCFRRPDCATDHYLEAAKLWEILAASKEETRKFEVEGFNLRKLNELGVRKQYQIKISNKFAALEKNLSDSENTNKARENKENIKTSAKESLKPA